MSSDLEARIALLERSELQRQRDERKWNTSSDRCRGRRFLASTGGRARRLRLGICEVARSLRKGTSGFERDFF